ncbi:MAG: ParB/RepB/Spo0J family partition protein [Planctomycetota bacterium]
MTAHRLGKGLDALIRQTEEAGGGKDAAEISINALFPGKVQPREKMEEEKLSELSDSIKEVGLLQPVVARNVGGKLEIVVGERRWRAAKLAGLTTVPVLVKEIDDSKALQLAIIENLQREDLNPIEKARAFKELMKAMQLTQEETAKKLGIHRTVLTNTVRLLELPHAVKDLIAAGKISHGHAKVLLSAEPDVRESLAERMVRDGLSVRELESIVYGRPAITKTKRAARVNPPHIRVHEEKLSELLSTKVSVTVRGKKGSGGKITIEFYNPDKFEDIIKIIETGAAELNQKQVEKSDNDKIDET